MKRLKKVIFLILEKHTHYLFATVLPGIMVYKYFKLGLRRNIVDVINIVNM